MKKETLKVCAKTCNECLFSKNRVILEEDVERIVQNCLDEDRFFICHKFSPPLNPDGGPVCCRAFYDRHKRDILPLRLATMLNLVEVVDVPTITLESL